MQNTKSFDHEVSIRNSHLTLSHMNWENNEPVLCIAFDCVKDELIVPSTNMKTLGIQLCGLPEADKSVLPTLDTTIEYIPISKDVYGESLNKFSNSALVAYNTASLDHTVLNGTDDNFLEMVDSLADGTSIQDMQILPGHASNSDDVDILITDQTTGISYLVEKCLNESQLTDPDVLLASDLLAFDDATMKAELSKVIDNHPLDVDSKCNQTPVIEDFASTQNELISCVQQITDQPIQSRARASLPVSHLMIGKNQYGFESVFAKKFIPNRTQFGPIEGILTAENIKSEEDQLHLSIELNGVLQKLDVSNENLSNWMCFVKMAVVPSQQNLILYQQDNNLYFRTINNIYPKQELLVGYSNSYAQRRNLSIKGHNNDQEGVWECFDCSIQFRSSKELLAHLATHTDKFGNGTTNDFDQNQTKQKDVREEMKTNDDFKNTKAVQYDSGADKMCKRIGANAIRKKNEYKCPKCYKYFATCERIQRHMMVHDEEAIKPLQCDKCQKRFLNNSALSCHIKTHLYGTKVYECPICNESFHHILQLKSHVLKHAVDGKFTCPHCKKVFVKYSIVRKHIRAFHCDKIHKCPQCEKAFPALDKLRMHLLKHSDHKEFLCADCGKQFKRKDKLHEHCKKVHAEESELENAAPAKQRRAVALKSQPTDYHRFIYKCHTCLLGFKRRGMLVNHLAKRHPEISPETVPELNLPIYRTTKNYYCNYCDKIYKSSSKRKAHILKNHPGRALPLGHRSADSLEKSEDFPNLTFSQTVGSITTHPQACNWCHRQYASKAKLLQHRRKKHADLLDLETQLQCTKQVDSPGNNESNLFVNAPKDATCEDDFYQIVSQSKEQQCNFDDIGQGLVPPR